MQQPDNTIVVLDDHLLIREAIEKIIAENTSYIFSGAFHTSSELKNYIERDGVPAFLLLDINLGNEDGILLCKQLRKQYPGLKIVMLTGLTQATIVKNAIKNGANGFMLKNMQKEELWECLSVVSRGETWLHKDLQQILLGSGNSGQSADNGYTPKLSRREKEVLELIMKEMTTQEIANTLFISVNTVETHRSGLMSKLGAKNIAGLVKITIEKGLLDG